ncbi:MAG: YjjG family noncanonical pyrimidine nucleotidase [Actinomycetia bacterium]|nr:YjjG family noncanonical pyrimidine nucleotidase [Actinomycetes bacterium]
MQYTTLLFDLDHTLFDFDASEELAFASTLATAGIHSPNGHLETFASINVALWKDVERGIRTPNEVRTLRFEQFIDTMGLDADPHDMADHYVVGLGANGDLYDGARDILEELAPHATLALISNGIGEVQRARIERLDLDRYFGSVVISGEVGTAKPGTRIFELVFDDLGGPDKATALMIGDSLTSDMQGGINFGIDTCWYAPEGSLPPDRDVTHQISSLDEIASIVGIR